MNTDAVPEVLAAIKTSDIGDEFEIIDALAFMSEDDRAVIFLWLAGYPQRQIALKFDICQQRVSQKIAEICAAAR